MDGKAPESTRLDDALTAALKVDPAFAEVVGKIADNPGIRDKNAAYFQALLDANRNSDVVTDAIAPFIEPRHPSQLYEAALEGGLLLAILWIVRVKFPKAPHGLLTGLFFGLYATFRIFAEQFREPDAAWVIEGMLTQGQFLSLFMYLFSAAFLIYAFRNRKGDSEMGSV